ncbi:MAG TPA: zinc ribbon domain-containing protein [Ktedonobacteraceae bacterium]
MVFCGQCGYQLAPGDKVCPRCGTKTDSDLIEHDPGSYNPTEISHAILERAPTRSVMPPNRASSPARPGQVEQGPLILGPVVQNEQLANETTTLMGAQNYAPQGSYTGYPGYPQQGGYGYSAAGYQPYQDGSAAALAEILEASRKGKIGALLLILFGLLFLISAIIVFLLNQQGIIFAS